MRNRKICMQYIIQHPKNYGICWQMRRSQRTVIALWEWFVELEPLALLQQFADYFKSSYGVECIAALHHNKTKTNYHIHLIFSERKLLENPIAKVATRNMFYNESGKRIRTKQEILNESGGIRKAVKLYLRARFMKDSSLVRNKRFSKIITGLKP